MILELDTEQQQQIWGRWKAEIDYAKKDKDYVAWLTRCDAIIKRYRDDRKNAADQGKKRFNILWSNVQTLKPAVYGKMPKPIVERRFMDRDPAARLASTLLERVCSFQMEVGYFHASTSRAVDDYLLPGLGQVWFRYEPTFETEAEAGENAKVEREERENNPQDEAQEVAEDGDGVPYERLTYERVCADYVFYKDFLWGPARIWREVPWVDRRSWLTHSEIAEKFYKGDMAKAKKIVLDYTPDRSKDAVERDSEQASFTKKAEIHEIWNKADRTVYFIPYSTPDTVLRADKDPALKLENFWPCPDPLMATTTNETLIPVPDYAEYQDQAQELDDLTNRISNLTTAIKAAGVYDSSVPALVRLLEEGSDNKLIPVDNWAQFTEKGGLKSGGIELIPMQEIIEVLLRLYEARAQVKTDLYEITGMSDIVRGQASGPAKTATEQRIKGQFASLRLQDRQEKVAEFCRNGLRIMAEIVAEQFTEDSLMTMSGHDQTIKDEIRKAVAAVPQPQMPPPQEGLPVDPMQQQAMQAQMMQQYQQAQAQAAQQAEQQQMELFQTALQILRSDRLRGFRIDIETDSTIQVDAEADKASAVELFTGTTQGIQMMETIIPAAPELLDPLSQLLMFTYRRFRVGRSMEAGLEDAIDKLKERLAEQAANPQPSPEQLKAQAEVQKQQMETQRMQQQAQIDQQKAQEEFALERQKGEFEMEQKRADFALEMEKGQMELQLEREKLELKRQEMGLQAMGAVQKARIQQEQGEQKLELSRQQHEMDRAAAVENNQLAQETARVKAEAAQRNANEPGE